MIRVESLTRVYGDHTAVDQVSFEINKGEIVGLLGHNGAGKTTIMKMLTGFLEPTAGHIDIHGLNLQTHRGAIQRQRRDAAVRRPDLRHEQSDTGTARPSGCVYRRPSGDA